MKGRNIFRKRSSGAVTQSDGSYRAAGGDALGGEFAQNDMERGGDPEGDDDGDAMRRK